ncbi:MAG: sigma-70 family RNA polymerase sigma factor [Candidatus Pacebacteria bacterium]|nr:sigma-70 family RNA polymerase sigma factor [Candidatus Paceibacterota bacterium]
MIFHFPSHYERIDVQMRHTPQNKRLEAEKAFNDIYTSHADALFRFCLVKVSDREKALDLTQEVFTRFWQRMLEEVETIEKPKTFLFAIARNAIIDWYRKKKSVSLDAMTNEETGDPYEPFSDEMVSAVRLESEGRFLVDKIGELEPGYRDAIYLRFVEGLAPPEVARILGVSANAASVRITRGLDKLRSLTGYDIEMQDEDSN